MCRRAWGRKDSFREVPPARLHSPTRDARLKLKTAEVSLEEAQLWLKAQDWSEHEEVSFRQDEQKLIDYIQTRVVRVDRDFGYSSVSIGELVVIAAGGASEITEPLAKKELRKRGIIVEFDGVIIANHCDPMQELLKDTRWRNDWARSLRNLFGSQRVDNKYFNPGIRSRGVQLPLGLFVDDVAKRDNVDLKVVAPEFKAWSDN